MGGPEDIRITVFGRTDVGLIREHNEDCFLVADVSADQRHAEMKDPVEFGVGPRGALFLVCDGMGGAAAGEVASHMAIESIAGALAAEDSPSRDAFARRLRRAIEDANQKIHQQSRSNQSERGMGTTCTAAALVDGTLVVGQIGDSRCYVLRRGRLAQVTKDQSLAWQLIEAGAMTHEEAKAFEHANIILQALGVQEQVEVAMSQVALRRGDLVIMSSDGLHGPVSDAEIAEAVAGEKDVKQACDRLIARALDLDGPDNVTVVVARFDGSALPEPTESDLVDFVAYDPGPDPTAPPRPERAERVTVEVAVPKDLLDLTGTPAPPPSEAKTPAPAVAPQARQQSLLTFVLLTVMAAAAGALLLTYERSRAVELEERAQAAAAAEAPPAPPMPPVPPLPPPTAPAVPLPAAVAAEAPPVAPAPSPTRAAPPAETRRATRAARPPVPQPPETEVAKPPEAAAAKPPEAAAAKPPEAAAAKPPEAAAAQAPVTTADAGAL